MIPRCQQCGATVAQDAMTCPYCRAPTAYGIAMQQRADEDARQSAAYAQAAQYQAQQYAAMAAREELERVAKQSLLWSIGAAVFCCLPGPQIVGVVLWLKARGLAKKLGAEVPGTATAGGAISIGSVVLGVGLLIIGIVTDNAEQEANTKRLAELDAATKNAGAAVLAPDTACALAEAYVRRNGFESTQGHRFEAFQCGKLVAEADRATVEDFHFAETSNHKKLDLNACFKRGDRWYVQSVQYSECYAGGGTTKTKPAPSSAPRRGK